MLCGIIILDYVNNTSINIGQSMIKTVIKLISIVAVATGISFGMSVGQLNKAPKAELMKIKGVGSKKADAIIKYRKSTPFKSMSDIREVKGVGASLESNIKNDVYKKSKPKSKSKSHSKKDSKKETKGVDSKRERKNQKDTKTKDMKKPKKEKNKTKNRERTEKKPKKDSSKSQK